MKTINELKETWNNDKEAYKTKELGGLQDFVADVFESIELFNIKRGLESTKIENRNNEFIKEKNKNQRRADIVIYYKGSEIVIPVEIEKYCHIEEGVGQLADYQNDYQKAYGILTDGYEWRFYNNTKYIKYTLDEILNKPHELKTFWEDYLKEENYYLNFFEKNGLFIEESLYIEENRELFFEDITNLIQRFKNKLNIVGYLKEQGTKDSEKKATEIAYAYFIQFILYKNLVDNAYTYKDNQYCDFKSEFEKRIENIYKFLKNRAYQGITSQIYGISHIISDKLYKPFNKEQEFINQKLHEVLCKADVELNEITLWLDIIVFIKKYNFSNMKNEIFGYIYENYLKELYEENNKGQYFTDRVIVNYMLDEMGYTTAEIRKLYKEKRLDKLSIIDPSCGSGTFLYSATNRIVEALFDGTEKRSKEIEEIINKNIFGLDIAEFPLYLAEMNILMRMLPIIFNEDYTNPIDKKIKIFKTQDSISEFMNTGITALVDNFENEVIENTQQKSLFENQVLDLSYKSYIRDEDDLKEMKDSMQPPKRRFDFVIGNPPYIGYNECSKQKMLFTQRKEIQMSNIYGVNLNTVPHRIKSSSPKPNLYSYFIALGGALLKNNGTMCYIIPQTILTSYALDVLRYYLSKYTTIMKIITFSGKLFIGRGLKGKRPVSTSSLIFVIKKQLPKEKHSVKIVNYYKSEETNIENILNSRGKNRESKQILQSKLYNKIDNWNFITKNENEINFESEYIKNSISIEDYRNTLKDYDLVQFDKGLCFDKQKITENETNWQIIKKNKNKYNIETSGKYIANQFIKFPQGSQGIQLFKNKYKIIWEYMNYTNFYFSDKNIMIDYNWVIISSNDKDEILYLLGIFNSKLTKFILNYYFKIENEQSINIGVQSIKQFIRLPNITKSKQIIRNKIIHETQRLLNLENELLSDFIDFTDLTIQNFDKFTIDDRYFSLYKDNEQYNLKFINKNKIKAIRETLNIKYYNKNIINLTELKNLNIIDSEEQQKIKQYIDDLVYVLYNNIDIDIKILNSMEKIREICVSNKFYNLL